MCSPRGGSYCKEVENGGFCGCYESKEEYLIRGRKFLTGPIFDGDEKIIRGERAKKIRKTAACALTGILRRKVAKYQKEIKETNALVKI